MGAELLRAEIRCAREELEKLGIKTLTIAGGIRELAANYQKGLERPVYLAALEIVEELKDAFQGVELVEPLELLQAIAKIAKEGLEGTEPSSAEKLLRGAQKDLAAAGRALMAKPQGHPQELIDAAMGWVATENILRLLGKEKTDDAEEA